MQQWFWYSSTVGITLDTVIITTTRYDNTSEISTQTIHGDIDALNSLVSDGMSNTSLIAEALSVAGAVTGAGPYAGGNQFTMVNGTDGGGVSIPYPTAYIEVSRIVSHKVNGPCSLPCHIDIGSAMYEGRNFRNTTRTGLFCSTTIGAYELETQYVEPVAGPGFVLPGEYGDVNNVSFTSWIMVRLLRA